MKKISALPNTVMTWAKVAAKTSNTVPVDQGTTKNISDTGLDPYKSKNQTNACVVI